MGEKGGGVMGGRYSDSFLREARESALAMTTAPQMAARVLHVDAQALADLVQEIQQHRATLGLVDGIPRDDPNRKPALEEKA